MGGLNRGLRVGLSCQQKGAGTPPPPIPSPSAVYARKCLSQGVFAAGEYYLSAEGSKARHTARTQSVAVAVRPVQDTMKPHLGVRR